MAEQEIRSVVDKFAEVARVLADADPSDKSEIFRQLGLRLTYYPGRRIVEAKIEPAQHGFLRVSEGGLNPGVRGNFPIRGNFHG
jgi:hypothetical protein